LPDTGPGATLTENPSAVPVDTNIGSAGRLADEFEVFVHVQRGQAGEFGAAAMIRSGMDRAEYRSCLRRAARGVSGLEQGGGSDSNSPTFDPMANCLASGPSARRADSAKHGAGLPADLAVMARTAIDRQPVLCIRKGRGLPKQLLRSS
jgi:hypothetical protein